jgi:hypothetical protein
MVNNMWEKDICFWLFEEDFRFTPNDFEPPVSYTPVGLFVMVGDKATCFAPEAAENRGEVQANRGIPQSTRWYELPTKVTDNIAFGAGTSVLHDVVKFPTVAHRASCGDLAWRGWQLGEAVTSPKQKGSPASGNMFIMLSVPGAEVLSGATASEMLPMGHLDCKLLSWMRDLPPTSLRCIYLLSTMGNSVAHMLDCETVFGGEASIRAWC